MWDTYGLPTASISNDVASDGGSIDDYVDQKNTSSLDEDALLQTAVSVDD